MRATACLPRHVGKPRVPLSGSFTPEVERWIRQQQKMFGASLSHVIVTAVSFVAGKPEADYRKSDQPLTRRRGRLLRLAV